MKKITITVMVMSVFISAASGRQLIREGEKSGIPDREDLEKEIRDTKEVKEKKKEVRQNQEETDPVFYDSTTSPKEMEKKSDIQD